MSPDCIWKGIFLRKARFLMCLFTEENLFKQILYRWIGCYNLVTTSLCFSKTKFLCFVLFCFSCCLWDGILPWQHLTSCCQDLPWEGKNWGRNAEAWEKTSTTGEMSEGCFSSVTLALGEMCTLEWTMIWQKDPRP